MNATPRLYNRFFLLLGGLALAISGGLVVAVQLNDAAATWWSQLVSPLTRWDSVWIYALTLGIIASAFIMAVILVMNQGGGTIKRVLWSTVDTEQPVVPGAVSINVALISDILAEFAEYQPDILTITVSCFESNRSRVLRIRAQLRKGASPAKIAGDIENKLADMDRELGQHIPRVIELVSGLKTLRRQTSAAQ